jgi:Family of unknown function (DUF5675)
MNLRVERSIFSSFSTIGDLLIEGEHECHTLEPVWLDSDGIKPRAIPEGTYKLSNRFSPKHNRAVPHVENVPGFEEIEIHIGNFPHDTEGCLLVGQITGPHPDFIGGSGLAFAALWEKLVPTWDRGEEITITYVNKRAE